MTNPQVAPNATTPTTSSYLLPSDVENPFDYLDTILYYVEAINDIALSVCDEDDIPKTHVYTLFTIVEQKLRALRELLHKYDLPYKGLKQKLGTHHE